MIPTTKVQVQLQTSSDLQTAKNLLSKAKIRNSKQRFENAADLSQKAMKLFKRYEEWEGVIAAIYELSAVQIEGCNFSLAAETIDFGLKKMEEMGLSFPIWKALFYENKARVLSMEGKLKEAIQYLNEGEEIIDKSKIGGNILVLNLLAQIASYTMMSNYSKAQELLERISQLLSHPQEEVDSRIMASLYYSKADIECQNSNYQLGKQHYQKALEYSLSHSFHKAMDCRIKLAMCEGHLGNHEETIAIYHELIPIYKAGSTNKDKIVLAYIYVQFMRIALNVNDKAKAVHYFENALFLYEQVGGFVQIYVFTLLANMAPFYAHAKNHSKLIECYKKSVEVGLELFGEKNTQMALVYYNLGFTYLEMNQFDESLNYFKKSLDIYIDLFDESHIQVAQGYCLLGTVWSKKGEPSKGLKHLYKSLEIYQSKYKEAHIEISYSYRRIADIFVSQGELASALKNYQLALLSFLPDFQNTDFYALPNIELCRLKQPTQFIELLKGKAAALLDYFNTLEETQPLEAIKALTASLDTCQLAIDYAQQLQKILKSEDSQLIFAKEMPPIYQLAIRITLLLSKHLGEEFILERAFNFHELAKALVLRISMQDNEAKLQVGIDSDLLAKEKDLRKRIETYLQKIEQEEAKKSQKEEVALRKYKYEHLNLLQEHQQLIERFEEDYPNYYQLKYNFQTVSVANIQQDLADNTVVVSYFIGPELGYIFVVTPYDYEVVSINLPKDFDQKIEAYLASIHAQNFKEFSRQSYDLYCLLIQPIEDLIFDPFGSELQQLVILPSGALHYLPFETLIRTPPKSNIFAFHQLEYLLKKYNIQYHYSATLYHQYLQKGKEKNPLLPSMPNAESPDFIGFAPIYTSDKAATQEALRELATDYSRWATRSDALQEGTLAPLPYSEKEVQNIEALFAQKGLKGQSFLYHTATKDHFKSLAVQAKYLHIAAHGLTNDEYPKLSGIVFHPTEEATDIHDSILSMGEMYQLQLQADLVVLSSCESGIGKLAKGEGMMAINRGFLYAGAKNVIYTLFKVLDKPSSELCEALFEKILEGKPYGEALRLAKLQLMEREDVDPKSWSGFVLLGP